MILHIVKEGETAFSIAREYGISVDRLIRTNGLYGVVDRLPVGLSLAISIPETTHSVRAGETLDSIANLYGVSLNSLWCKNPELDGGDDIDVGQELVIAYRDKPIYDFDIGGYAYTYISESLLNEALPAMKIAMPFTYGFTENAELVPTNDEQMLARCSVYGTLPYMHLSTLTNDGNFDSRLADTLLSTFSLWERLSDAVMSVMLEKGYRGLDIDFEFLDARNRELYPLFIAYMRSRLSRVGCPIITALPPKSYAEQSGALYEGADYSAIGRASDYVLLMTYEWGYTYGPPMPVSPIPSIRQVLDYAVTEIPREKIYMGISNYGYDWTLPYQSGVSRARSLSNVEAVRLASESNARILYDSEYGAPYFYYTASDKSEHEVWFEDARSIVEKLSLISEYDFHGGIYWNLNRENPQNIAVLSALMST